MKVNFDFISPENPIFQAYLKEIFTKYHWTIYFNATFWVKTSQQSAEKKLKHFLKNLNSRDILLVDKYCHCYAFYERHNTSSGIHVHALIDRINPDYAPILHNRAKSVLGEWSKVTPFNPNDLAVHYVVKKIIQDTALDHYHCFKINCNHYKVRGTTLITPKGYKS